MLNSLINRIKAFRKARYFKDELFLTKKKYAFIGVGTHSLSNLYPVLHHFGITLKYICTRSSSWENEMSKLFPGCRFVNNIEIVLQDNEVEGVFVSASASEHFNIVSKLLQACKKVFVEKPPCESLTELKELIQIDNNNICKVGLQRRYWPATKKIIKRTRKAQSYTYSFHTGPFFEGDTLTGLFIHPIDFALYLFGPAEINSCKQLHDNKGITLHLHLTHSNNVSGLIECSTHHSWNTPMDIIQINTDQEYLKVQYPTLMEAQVKPNRIMNIPAERLLDQPVIKKEYYSVKNFILPVSDLNTIYIQGFYSELSTFIKIVEGMDNTTKRNDLPGLINIYSIFEAIRKC